MCATACLCEWEWERVKVLWAMKGAASVGRRFFSDVLVQCERLFGKRSSCQMRVFVMVLKAVLCIQFCVFKKLLKTTLPAAGLTPPTHRPPRCHSLTLSLNFSEKIPEPTETIRQEHSLLFTYFMKVLLSSVHPPTDPHIAHPHKNSHSLHTHAHWTPP